MKKIAIILPARLPVPAIYGGAVETIIQLLLDENEKQRELEIHVFSTFSKEACKKSKKYKWSKFVWIRRGFIYNVLNFCIRSLRRILLSNLDHLDLQIIKNKIKKQNYFKIIIHGNTTYLKGISKIEESGKIIFYTHAHIFKEKSVENLAFGAMANTFACVSHFIKNKVVENVGVNPEKVIVLKNAIDFDSFSKAIDGKILSGLRRKFDIGLNEVTILFAGRIVEDKGIKHLLRALFLLPEDLKYKLLIVGSFGSGFGEASYKNAFSKEVESLSKSLGSKVIFTGYIQNSELSSIYSISDILIMPSICEDAAPLVALEGMSSGLPVITTTMGGIPEYVTPEAGILINPSINFDQYLSDAILKLIMDKSLRERMANAGKKIAVEFSPSRYYEDHLNLVCSH